MSTTQQAAEAEHRVTTLELFFDLVFVFTITQLTSVLAHDPTGRGFAQVALMMGIIWWMYGGYAWLTNAVVVEGVIRRLVLLLGMAAYLVLSLTIREAVTTRSDALAFGFAYLAVVVIHAALFTRAAGRGARGIWHVAPYNLTAAADRPGRALPSAGRRSTPCGPGRSCSSG